MCGWVVWIAVVIYNKHILLAYVNTPSPRSSALHGAEAALEYKLAQVALSGGRFITWDVR